jgi:hypothetical protein
MFRNLILSVVIAASMSHQRAVCADALGAIDAFSHKYEKSLEVTVQYNGKSNVLILNIKNKTAQDVEINDPALVSAGNVYIRTDSTIFPPPGSNLFFRSKSIIKARTAKEYRYQLEIDAIGYKNKDSLKFTVAIDLVNGESKRTKFEGAVNVIDE